jgi:hypothetical protein
VTFGFILENDSDARTLVVGIIPFLRDTADKWYLSFFKEEAKIRHMLNKWDPSTRQVFSFEEDGLDEYLADDDELNKTDGPTVKKKKVVVLIDESNIQVNVGKVVLKEKFPAMYKDDDSISMFRSKASASVLHTSSSF